VDKLLREGVSNIIGKDKGGDINAHLITDEDCRGCNTVMKHIQTYKKTPFDLDTKLERELYKRKYKNSTGAVNESFDTYRHDNSKLKNFDYRPDKDTSKEKGWAYKAKTDGKEHPLNETYYYNSKGALEI
jgi:hypothetical protein